MLAALRSWLNAPRQLAAAQQQLAENRTALVAAAETINLMRLETGRYELMEVGGKQRAVDRDLVSDWAEADMMAGAGPSMPPMSNGQVQQRAVAIKERLWELELALEDRGWQRQLALAQTEFSRYGLQQIILISRLYFIKNPLVRRGVLVSSHYVFGRGVEITSDDDAANEVIQDFLADNAQELGQTGLVEKDQALHTDGGLFFVFFANQGTGKLAVRTIDATEISDIITNPDDASEAWYYRRTWMARSFDQQTGVVNTERREAYYPALDFPAPVKTIGGIEVMAGQPVFHMKVGGQTKWLFGCPEVYCAIDWARAYKSFLEDWASLNRALARFAWNVETKGGQQAIQTFQKVLSSTLGQGGTAIESNPPPATASAFVTGPGNKLTPMNTGHVTVEPEKGRRLMLMVAAAFGLPETFFGDASTGSLATAQSLDRPTELKFLERQERWRYVLQRILTYALQLSNTAGKGKLREARAKVGKNGDLSDITVTVKFPSVLEHDIPQMISAIVQAATLGGFQMGGTMDMRTAAQLLMAELGVEDPKGVVDAMYPVDGPDKYDPQNYSDNGKADAIEDAPALPPQPGAHLVTPSFGKEAALTYAVQRLTEACNKMLARR